MATPTGGWTTAQLDSFFARVLEILGMPVTRWRLDAFEVCQHYEGTPPYIWNPLDTTQPNAAWENLNYDNGNGPGNWNTLSGPGYVAHVKVYKDQESGAQATAATLRLSYYTDWIAAFNRQRGDSSVYDDLRTWGWSQTTTEAIVNEWNTGPGTGSPGGSPPVDPPPADPPPDVPVAGYYKVVAGDTFSNLAQRAYGNSTLWPGIYCGNQEGVGCDPGLLKVGAVLRIPTFDEAAATNHLYVYRGGVCPVPPGWAACVPAVEPPPTPEPTPDPPTPDPQAIDWLDLLTRAYAGQLSPIDAQHALKAGLPLLAEIILNADAGILSPKAAGDAIRDLGIYYGIFGEANPPPPPPPEPPPEPPPGGGGGGGGEPPPEPVPEPPPTVPPPDPGESGSVAAFADQHPLAAATTGMQNVETTAHALDGSVSGPLTIGGVPNSASQPPSSGGAGGGEPPPPSSTPAKGSNLPDTGGR